MQQSHKVLMLSRAWYPNHQLLFEEVQSQLPESIGFYYFVLSSKERGRPWELQGETVKPAVIPGLQFSLFSKEVVLNFSLAKYLNALSPSLLIITPWSEMGCFLAKRYAQERNIPTIGWVVGLRNWSPTLGSRIRRKVTQYLARSFVKGNVFTFADGIKSKQDAIEQGAPPDRIIIVKHVIDENHFDYKAHELSPSARRAERNKLSLDDRPVFLCIAQLIERKGIASLIQAYEKLLKKNHDVLLLLVGDGPLRSLVDDFSRAYPRNCKWFPTISYDSIPHIYALSDYCVLPSLFDDWGNVVNESHCARIPIICSDGAVASYDLIENGRTGLTYKAGDADALTTLMEYALNHPDEVKAMSRTGYSFIQSQWNTKESARIWAKYIGMAVANNNDK